MTTPTTLAVLAQRLAALDLDAVCGAALAAQAEALAAAVREALSHPPGDEHRFPWLQSGALRGSIAVAADPGGREAVVASTSDVAVYQEHGTAAVPPRPFLAPAAAAAAPDAADAIGRAAAAAIAG